jgi:hypothetical protein
VAKQSKNQNKIKWTQAIRAWKKSGLKASVFCRKNRLGLQSFYAWRRRLAGAKISKGRDHRAFLPVQVVTSPGENQPVLELTLKNGRVLRLYRAMPVVDLVELAHGLEAEVC